MRRSGLLIFGKVEGPKDGKRHAVVHDVDGRVAYLMTMDAKRFWCFRHVDDFMFTFGGHLRDCRDRIEADWRARGQK